MNIEQKPTGLDQKMMKKVSNHLDGLLKPPGSLGELEHMAVRLAGIYGTERIEIRKPRLLIFAADHGVTAEGVASAPKEFTFRQTAYIVQSLTGAGVLAKQAGADLAVIDVGIDSQKTIPGVTCAKIRRGTGNILHEDAMTEKNLEQALEAGARAVRMALEEGSNLIGVLESERLIKHTSTKLVLYDRIELIVPERRAELVEDLEKRTGLKINNVEVGHIDFLKDAAFIKIYYNLEKGQTGSIDSLTKAKNFVEQ